MNSIELRSESLQHFKAGEPIALDTRDRIRINNVLGINKYGSLPARYLSGLIPTFSLAKSIQEQSDGLITPQIRVFRPIRIFQHTNGIPENEVAAQLENGNRSLRSFQQEHFPQTELFVEEDNEITASALELLNAVSEVVEAHCDPDTRTALKISGGRHGGAQGERNALIYAAHHPFGWNDASHTAIFSSIPPDTVINTLPPSEKKFNQIREMITPLLGNIPEVVVFDRKKHQLTISMSGTPHYQVVEDDLGNQQEPTLDDVSSVPVVEVLTDMQQRFAGEKDKFLKEKLRGVRRDFKNLLDFLTNGNFEEKKDESLTRLIGNDGGSL